MFNRLGHRRLEKSAGRVTCYWWHGGGRSPVSHRLSKSFSWGGEGEGLPKDT